MPPPPRGPTSSIYAYLLTLFRKYLWFGNSHSKGCIRARKQKWKFDRLASVCINTCQCFHVGLSTRSYTLSVKKYRNLSQSVGNLSSVLWCLTIHVTDPSTKASPTNDVSAADPSTKASPTNDVSAADPSTKASPTNDVTCGWFLNKG